MIFFPSGVRSFPRRPVFLADACLQNIGNTSATLIWKSKAIYNLKFRHQILLIILLPQRVNFIKLGQQTVAILGTLIYPGTVRFFNCFFAFSTIRPLLYNFMYICVYPNDQFTSIELQFPDEILHLNAHSTHFFLCTLLWIICTLQKRRRLI